MAVTPAARWVPILDALGVERPGDVGWVHGANSNQKLMGALSDPAVHFIEGDITEVDGKIISWPIPRSQRATWILRDGWT